LDDVEIAWLDSRDASEFVKKFTATKVKNPAAAYDWGRESYANTNRNVGCARAKGPGAAADGK
jgi:hypothetical protein